VLKEVGWAGGTDTGGKKREKSSEWTPLRRGGQYGWGPREIRKKLIGKKKNKL